MIEAIVGAVHDVLKGANTSRSFTVQTLLPGSVAPEKRSRSTDNHASDSGLIESEFKEKKRPVTAPNYKVRTDLSSRTLDSMLAPAHPSQMGDYVQDQSQAGSKRRAVGDKLDDAMELEHTDEEEAGVDVQSSWAGRDKGKGRAVEIKESLCEFTSIGELRRAAKKRGNAGEP